MIIRCPIPESRITRAFALAYFYFTGEALNPWRCEACATRKQVRQYHRHGADSLEPYPTGYPIPYLCRKCGVDYAR